MPPRRVPFGEAEEGPITTKLRGGCSLMMHNLPALERTATKSGSADTDAVEEVMVTVTSSGGNQVKVIKDPEGRYSLTHLYGDTRDELALDPLGNQGTLVDLGTATVSIRYDLGRDLLFISPTPTGGKAANDLDLTFNN